MLGYVGLVVVCVSALAVRLPAVRYGLPYLFHPDDPGNIATGVKLADQHTVDPHLFSYPSFMYDVIASVRVLGRALGGAHRPLIDMAQNAGTGRTTDSLLFTELRLIVVAFSVGACVLVWIAIRWTTHNGWAALFGGLGMAFSPLLVANAVFVTPDTFSAFFAAAGLLSALLIYRRGIRLDYLIAGVAVGLAAGSKYNAAMVAAAPLIAHVTRWRKSSLRTADRLLLGGVATVVVFLVVTPSAFLHTHEFVTGALKELRHYQTGHPGVTGSSLRFYITALHKDSAIWLIGLLLGLVGLTGRWKVETAIVGGYALLYMVLVSTQVVHFDRDILPLLPAMCMLAGFGFASVGEWLARVRPESALMVRYGAAGLVVLAAAVLIVPAVQSARVTANLEDHPRSEARAWLQDNVPAGSVIVMELYGPWMPPGQFKVLERAFAVEGGPLPSNAAAIVVTENGTGRFLAYPRSYRSVVAAYEAFAHRWCLAKQFDNGPWVRIFVPCGRAAPA